MATTIKYLSLTASSDGAGTRDDPAQASQMASLLSGSTELDPIVVRILRTQMGVGFTASQSLGAGSVIEVGSINTPGPIGAIIEGDPDADGPVVLTAAVGLAESDWALVPTSSAVYQALLTNAAAAALEAVWQDYYGDAPSLWTPSGETDTGRRRALVNESIAANTNAAKAGVSGGGWGTVAVGDGTTWLVVHANGDVDLTAAGDSYISTSSDRPSPTGFHARAALSLLECQHLKVRNLRVDRFCDAAGGTGIAVVNNSVSAGGAALGDLEISSLRVHDCTDHLVRINTSEGANAQNIQLRDLVIGGLACVSSQNSAALEIGPLAASPTITSISAQRIMIGAHRILAGDGSVAVSAGSTDNYGIRIGEGGNLKQGCQNIALGGVDVVGVAGAADKTVAIDLRYGGDPASGREWDWKAYPCRVRDIRISGLPQLFFDNPCAVAQFDIDLTTDDDKATTTGSFDIGSNTVQVLLEGGYAKVREGGATPLHAIGMSAGSTLRIQLCDILNATASPLGALIAKTSAGIVNTLHCRSSIFRNTDGGRFADLGDDSFSVDRCVFGSGFADTNFYRGETTGSIAKSGFVADGNVSRSRVDFDTTGDYESDGITQKPNAAARGIVDYDDRLVGLRGHDGAVYDGRPGATHRGAARRKRR